MVEPQWQVIFMNTSPFACELYRLAEWLHLAATGGYGTALQMTMNPVRSS